MDGLRLYADFEINFQLDGHFWLQYGLYNKECGEYEQALTMLQRSIRAYPDNPFAVHAYAQLQLQVAARRATFDSVTSTLISDAVKNLLQLDSSSQIRSDHYPIVTLANCHVEALMKHNMNDEALRYARQYFGRLQDIEKTTGAIEVSAAKERVFKFVTLGVWEAPEPRFVRRSRRRDRFGRA